MLEYITALERAIASGDYLWVIVICCCMLLVVAKATNWELLSHPRYRLKSIIFFLLATATLVLYTGGLLTWHTSGLVFLLLVSLAAVFIHSSCGNLLWPCSSILRDASDFIRANELKRAEQMLNRYMQYFLDPVERYSYYLTQAAIASAKYDDRRSIELLNKIDVKTLNSAEKTRLELLRARYFTHLGDHKKALQNIEHLSDPSDEYSLQISLIRAVSAEFEGDLTRSSEILFDAIESASDRLKNADYFCVLNNYGRIQKIIKNETESLTHYRKALKLAKDLNEKHLMHVAYQNVIPSLVSAHRQDEARQFISKYRSIVDFANPDDLVEYYNFLIEFYREANNRNKLFETIDEARERVYPFVSRKEQVVCDISQLRMRWNGGVLAPAFLYQIEDQYPEYAELSIVERFRCYMELHHVLQRLKEDGRLILSQEALFDQNRENIRRLIPALEDHLDTTPEYCVFEKCQVTWDIIRGKKCGTDDYDKERVLRMLEDIREIHIIHGNYIEAFNAGLDICDEALGQKQYEKMWEYTQLAMTEVQKIRGHPAEASALIRIACYAYSAGKHDLAREYLGRFERTGVQISHSADWIQGYYIGLKQELSSGG